jgi:hypothetical protein
MNRFQRIKSLCRGTVELPEYPRLAIASDGCANTAFAETA